MFRLVAFLVLAACSDEGARTSNDTEVKHPSPRADLASLATLERELKEIEKQIAVTAASIAATSDPMLVHSTKLQLTRLQQRKQEADKAIAAKKREGNP